MYTCIHVYIYADLIYPSINLSIYLSTQPSPPHPSLPAAPAAETRSAAPPRAPPGTPPPPTPTHPARTALRPCARAPVHQRRTVWPLHDMFCMVHGVQKSGWGGGVVYCAIVVQYYCNSVGNADGEGQEKDDSLVHKSFEVKEYLVKAKGRRGVVLRRASSAPSQGVAVSKRTKGNCASCPLEAVRGQLA